jgi:hypothetical protein
MADKYTLLTACPIVGGSGTPSVLKICTASDPVRDVDIDLLARFVDRFTDVGVPVDIEVHYTDGSEFPKSEYLAIYQRVLDRAALVRQLKP